CHMRITERLINLIARIVDGSEDLDGTVTPAVQEAMRKSLAEHPGNLGRAVVAAVEAKTGREIQDRLK
ncbi:hypothetical protein, partial [Streptococcus pseudopneumoniae]|uniref:hypothetical protein n=1 Tax=Streptococcus pseudopneumoniae TaxID=257758 RepID=UPI0019D5D8D7